MVAEANGGLQTAFRQKFRLWRALATLIKPIRFCLSIHRGGIGASIGGIERIIELD